MFKTAEDTLKFILAGNARFTIVSRKTGTRFTYRVRKAAKDGYGVQDHPWFVAVLTGSNNETDYTFFTSIFGHQLRHGRRASISPEAPSAKAFAWFWAHLQKGNLPEGLEVHHEGRCGRCGRSLTVPESIESGFGPECAGRI